MTITYGRVVVECDRATETDGRITLWSGETPIRTLANLPPHIEITVEGGEIEHIPNPLEAAEDEINDLQADLAAAAASVAEWRSEYESILADDEAKRARLVRISELVTSLGEGPTLTKLLSFLKDLKDILTETGGEIDG